MCLRNAFEFSHFENIAPYENLIICHSKMFNLTAIFEEDLKNMALSWGPIVYTPLFYMLLGYFGYAVCTLMKH